MRFGVNRIRLRVATVAAVDVKRAADFYAQGWTLRQIAAELGLSSTTVSDQLRRAGVTMRRRGPSAHPASTQQILELRDQDLTWNEVAEKVDMTVSALGAATERPGHPSHHGWAVGSGFWPTPSNSTLRLASGSSCFAVYTDLSGVRVVAHSGVVGHLVASQPGAERSEALSPELIDFGVANHRRPSPEY
jgi:AraC-like DNA-binding protein